MIDPAAPITHLDPGGVRHLMALVRHRMDASGHTLTVLHDAGVVVAVVDSNLGHVAGHREAIADAGARAAELLGLTGVERVVVLDRSQLDAVGAAVVELARQLPSQGDLLLAANDLWWSHPAVATAPVPPISSWAPVRQALRKMPDGWLHVALGGDDGPQLDAHLRVEGGWVREITGRMPRQATVASLAAEWSVVEAAAAAVEPWAALLDAIADGRVAHRGLETVLASTEPRS